MQIVSKELTEGWTTSQNTKMSVQRTPSDPTWVRSISETPFKIGDPVRTVVAPDKVNYNSPSTPARVFDVPETGMCIELEFSPTENGPKFRQMYPVWKVRHATVEEALDPYGK